MKRVVVLPSALDQTETVTMGHSGKAEIAPPHKGPRRRNSSAYVRGRGIYSTHELQA
jgi:hypothetical protein